MAGWQENGVPVCTESLRQDNPQIVADGTGGFIVVWEDRRPGGNRVHIYAQRLDAHGDPLWAVNGVGVCTELGDRGNLRIISDGAGGVIALWELLVGEDTYEVYAQRVDGSGTILWAAAGVKVGHVTEHRYDARLVSDGAGGAIIAWVQYETYPDIRAQRLNASGNRLWGGSGVTICDAIGTQDNPDIVSDGAGGAIITWEDDRLGFDIAAQRVNGSGSRLWTTNGIVVCNPDDYTDDPRITTDGAGGAIITWVAPRQPGHTQTDIYAQRVDASGGVLWGGDGIKICGATQFQNQAKIISDDAGGAIIIWEDDRDFAGDIYAQRVNGSGTALWTTDGIAVCTDAALQEMICITPSEPGGAYIAWEDNRSGGTDIYAQRIDSLGNALWDTNGVAVSIASNDQRDPAITTDGQGSAIIAWSHYDPVSNYDVYALGIDRGGFWGDNDPVIGMVRDVPHDQGGWVTITWPHSPFDRFPYELITHYAVWRKYDEGDWELMTTMDAYYRDYYTYASATLADSSISGTAYHHFKVIAHTENALIYWESPPDSGYSVDNFAPPGAFLAQNYPNPFNPQTSIAFGLKKNGHVTLDVYDAAGRLVRSLVNEQREAGSYVETWNGLNDQGRTVASGVYFYMLDTGVAKKTKKMVLLR
jgi:hypothetical protein